MLQVYLLLNSLPQDPPGFAPALQALHQSMRIALTVINNGQPFGPKRIFHQLGLTCKLIELPLRFHPAQLLAWQLGQRSKASQFLWLEDRLLWHPAHLGHWLQELESWTWIAPRLLPGQTLPQTRQIYQVQAMSRPQTEPRLQSFVPDHFPPALCFGANGIPVLREWLRPEGQLPLLMMGACDTSVPAWHPAPASETGQTEYALTIDEALARWQRVLEIRDTPERSQALLESLQRALPDSPAVYARLAPMLEAQDAVPLLESAMRRRLYYPDLLAMLGQALIACHQPELAGVYLRYLQQRFAAFEMPVSPWQRRGGASIRIHPDAVPVHLRLSVCLVLRDEAEALPACLDSLAGLEAELVVVDTGSSDQSREILAARGIQVHTFPWNADFAAARNYALDQASGDWVLMLDADERLEPGALPQLRRLLADPPPGLPCYSLLLRETDASGELLGLRQAVRLFPRHPLLRYHGAGCEALVYEGPGQIQTLPWPGLELQHRLDATRRSRLRRRIAALEAWLAAFEAGELDELGPEGAPGPAQAYLALGDCLAGLGRSAEALAAFARARDLDPDPEVLTAASLGALEILALAEDPAPGLALALEQERACQDLADYWYLRGLLKRAAGNQAAAVAAFERCLGFRPGSAPLLRQLPARCESLPLAQLAELYRAQAHHPAQEPRRRQQVAQQWLTTLQHLLQRGEDRCLQLAEAALVAAPLQRGSALALYREYLPASLSASNRAYYAETALLYLEGTPESLSDRLPPDYSFETIRELQRSPETLHGFAQALWQRPELDGPELATALLRIAAQAHQDLSLWLQLSHLRGAEGGPDAALEILRDASILLPANPSLLCQQARLQLEAADSEPDRLETAQTLILQALALRPDLEEALHLQQLLTAAKRRSKSGCADVRSARGLAFGPLD